MNVIEDPDILLGSIFNSFDNGFTFVLKGIEWIVASKGKKRILLKSDKGNITINVFKNYFYGNTKYNNFCRDIKGSWLLDNINQYNKFHKFSDLYKYALNNGILTVTKNLIKNEKSLSK